MWIDPQAGLDGPSRTIIYEPARVTPAPAQPAPEREAPAPEPERTPTPERTPEPVPA